MVEERSEWWRWKHRKGKELEREGRRFRDCFMLAFPFCWWEITCQWWGLAEIEGRGPTADSHEDSCNEIEGMLSSREEGRLSNGKIRKAIK